MSKIGVGIVGVSSSRGWAGRAHIPALKILDGSYELRAISATRIEGARQAAATFGVAAAYDNNEDLIRDPSVDLVVVTVKVPEHHAIVSAALRAGKHVYCEWPLGRTLEEGLELSALAKAAGVRAIVGLQARMSPDIAHVAQLVSQGFVGRVLSTSIVASGRSWGATVEAPSVYLLDRANGATMLSIPFGHSIDAVCAVLGEFDRLSATLATRRTEIRQVETGGMIPMTTHDQVAVCGTLSDGVIASIHFRGGMSAKTNFLWEINGDEGDIVVTADAGHIQMMELTVEGARKGSPLELLKTPPAFYQFAELFPAGPPRNVGILYAQLANDLRDNTNMAPSFDDAVKRHILLAMIEKSANEHREIAYPEIMKNLG